MSPIKSPRDFWTGILYAGVGSVLLDVSSGYSLGRAARMGPGYFPRVLCTLLVVFGLVALVRSFVTPGAPIGKLAWKEAALVCGSVIVFGLLLRGAGLLISLASLIAICARASTRFHYGLKTAAVMTGLIAFCALVFVKALGLPMPLLGSWLGG